MVVVVGWLLCNKSQPSRNLELRQANLVDQLFFLLGHMYLISMWLGVTPRIDTKKTCV